MGYAQLFKYLIQLFDLDSQDQMNVKFILKIKTKCQFCHKCPLFQYKSNLPKNKVGASLDKFNNLALTV